MNTTVEDSYRSFYQNFVFLGIDVVGFILQKLCKFYQIDVRDYYFYFDRNFILVLLTLSLKSYNESSKIFSKTISSKKRSPLVLTDFNKVYFFLKPLKEVKRRLTRRRNMGTVNLSRERRTRESRVFEKPSLKTLRCYV